MSDTHKQWNSGSKEWGVTFCAKGAWNLELSDEPTCEKCRQDMARERFRVRGSHEVLKQDGKHWRNGIPLYYIVERKKHNFSYRDETVAQFEKREDRDAIYEGMRLGGYCGHSAKSWIRSIPPYTPPFGLPRIGTLR